MPKVELDESELAGFRNIQKFVDTALQNPETREQMLRIQKKINPNAVIPEIDAADNVMKAVKGIEEKVNGLMTTLTERETRDTESRRTSELSAKVSSGQKMLKDSGYNDDGIKKIEELMVAEGIASYAAGLAFFERLNPPPRPAESSTSRWGSMSDQKVEPTADDYKELWDSKGQSENWLQQSLERVRSDFH